MSRLVGTLLGLSLYLGLLPAGAQTLEDATVADPEAHQVVLENEHVRVITALAAPGHKSPMHTHPPMVIISLGSARARMTLQDGSQQILDLRPGAVLWIDGAVHSWELLAGEVNVVGVEVKSAKMPADSE